jgi:hypothetical protein
MTSISSALTLVGNVYTVRAGISRITGEPQVLAGLRVEVIGAGGMVGDLSVRLVDEIEEVAAILAERDAWWTVERVEEILAGEGIEFDREDLV